VQIVGISTKNARFALKTSILEIFSGTAEILSTRNLFSRQIVTFCTGYFLTYDVSGRTVAADERDAFL